MSEQRARLIYGGIKYFTEDLYTIGRKESVLCNGNLVDFSLSRKLNCLILKIQTKQGILERNIPFDCLRFYNLGKPVETNSPHNSCNKYLSVSATENYTREEIMRIGQEVASLWGGRCLSCDKDEKNKRVVFSCIEHGEHFTTTVDYNELKEYKI